MKELDNFKIKVKRFIEVNKSDKEDVTINEALQTIYSYDSECTVYVDWADCTFELNLSAQIADVYSDILRMIHLLLDDNEKEFSIYWGSNSFMAQWVFSKKNDNTILHIKSFWTSVHGGKEVLDKLENTKDTIVVENKSFISEWVSLLKLIKDGLISAGYNFNDLEDFNDTNRIIKMADKI